MIQRASARARKRWILGCVSGHSPIWKHRQAEPMLFVRPVRIRLLDTTLFAWGRFLAKRLLAPCVGIMPRQIPAVILGWLAIDQKWQDQGLGKALLQDAVQRSARAAKEVSARLLIAHAISPEAEAFYLHYGFTRLPTETPTYALDLIKFSDLSVPLLKLGNARHKKHV